MAMAGPISAEPIHKKEGKVGMTSLNFRSKQYTFPSLIVNPDTDVVVGSTDADNVCVLLDVGLFCPHCSGTFTAKFVRSHGRLALSKQGSFDLAERQGAIQPGQLMLTPEQAENVSGSPQQQKQRHTFAKDSDSDSDLGLKRNVEKEFNESGIHVHITPQTPGEQPKYARIVPLSPQQHSHHHHPAQQQQHPHHHHSHSHQHHRHSHVQAQPHPLREVRNNEQTKPREQDPILLERQKMMKQNLKLQHRERQLQIRQQQARYLQSLDNLNNKKRMTQFKAGHVYVEQKSSQYVIKHDLSKKHGSKRVPPPPPPKHSLRHSPNKQSPPPKTLKESSPMKTKKHEEQPAMIPRQRRGSSVDRQEIIYEGENIAAGGCIETNLDDFSQTMTATREFPGQIRTPPAKHRRQSSNERSTESKRPMITDPYKVIAKRKRKGHAHSETQQDENKNVPKTPLEIPSSDRTSKHESLEQLTPTKANQQNPWASDNDIYRQPLPVNQLAKQTPPKIPPRIKRPPSSPGERQIGRLIPRNMRQQDSESQSVTSEEGQGSFRSRSNSEVKQENWIKIKNVTGGVHAEETLGPVVEPIKNESQEFRAREFMITQQVQTHTDERIMNYIGEQAAINKQNREATEADMASYPVPAPRATKPGHKQVERSEKYQTGMVVPPLITVATSSSANVSDADPVSSYDELNDMKESVFKDITKLSSHSDVSDTSSEETNDVFNPEDTVDEILESVDTDNYSPTSTLSRAFTGPRGKKKQKKPSPLMVTSEESELHIAVSQIVEQELRTPSPETVLDEILEGVEDGAVPDSPDWDSKHSKTTTASLNTKTSTTYTSELLHQLVTAHEDKQLPEQMSSEPPTQESLQSTLTALNVDQERTAASPSTSCECLTEDTDNVSLDRSSYEGISENSENEDAVDHQGPGSASRRRPDSDASIERIIDRTLFLTDKILAAYPEIERNEQAAKHQDETMQSEVTHSSFSDYDEVGNPEDSHEEDLELEAIVSENIEIASNEDGQVIDHRKYQLYGTEEELKQYMRTLRAENSPSQEDFDSQRSAQSPPVAAMEEMIKDRIPSSEDTDDDGVARVRSRSLDKITKDLYEIQHSLASDGEKWLMEDFYQDTELAELESISDQGTMEKKRLSLQFLSEAPTVERVEEEQLDDSHQRSERERTKANADTPVVPRKVQFWVPQTERGTETTEEDDKDSESLETFEQVEERLREMEQTVKEMGALDNLAAPGDLEEVISKEDLREVDDDQYNTDHTTEDMDQLESSCAEDVSSEIDDVIEALMMEQQFGDDDATTDMAENRLGVCQYDGKTSHDAHHESKLCPLRYVSPISTSGSEYDSDEENRSSQQCVNQVPEMTISNAESQTLVQDVVKLDSKQRSEACITYVNIDGSSSDSISNSCIDESDDSVIALKRSTVASSLTSVQPEELQESLTSITLDEEIGSERTSVATESVCGTQDVVETHVTAITILGRRPEVPKELITTVVIDKSSESSGSSYDNDTDSEKDIAYSPYAECDDVEHNVSIATAQCIFEGKPSLLDMQAHETIMHVHKGQQLQNRKAEEEKAKEEEIKYKRAREVKAREDKLREYKAHEIKIREKREREAKALENKAIQEKAREEKLKQRAEKDKIAKVKAVRADKETVQEGDATVEVKVKEDKSKEEIVKELIAKKQLVREQKIKEQNIREETTREQKMVWDKVTEEKEIVHSIKEKEKEKGIELMSNEEIRERKEIQTVEKKASDAEANSKTRQAELIEEKVHKELTTEDLHVVTNVIQMMSLSDSSDEHSYDEDEDAIIDAKDNKKLIGVEPELIQENKKPKEILHEESRIASDEKVIHTQEKSETLTTESTTDVSTFETKEVFSTEQAQQFLKHMFSTSHVEGRKEKVENAETSLSEVSQVVPEEEEDYIVKEEEVSTQEITLIFAWPKNMDRPIKRYEEPFREIHLRRVTRIKDFDIEVVEGPTITTIERPGVVAIEDDQSGPQNQEILPSNDSIVVSHRETVSKRIIPSQQSSISEHKTHCGEAKENREDKDEDDDDDDSSCGRPLSTYIEVDLDELLSGVSDVSESFEDFGGRKLKNSKQDASAQTEGLSHGSCTWSDNPQSGLLDMASDCTADEACSSSSSTGEGEQCMQTHRGTQDRSMLAHSHHQSDTINQSQYNATCSNSEGLLGDTSTETGGGYIGSLLAKGCGINAHGADVQVYVDDTSGSVQHTLASTPSIVPECPSVAAPSDKTNTSPSSSVSLSIDGADTTSQSHLSQSLSTMTIPICFDVLPSFHMPVPCSAGPAYVKRPLSFRKGEGFSGQRLLARGNGDQLLLVAVGNEDFVGECELPDGDPGFSFPSSGQCCCARSPFFDRVTLVDPHIDTNNCADASILRNEFVKYADATTQLFTEGTLECIQPFPKVERATWTETVEFGMALRNFSSFMYSPADCCSENACLRHPGDKLDGCTEISTMKTEFIDCSEMFDMESSHPFSRTVDTKAYLAEVVYAGSEHLASYEPTLYSCDTNYGKAIEKEELAAWMMNVVILTMFAPKKDLQLQEEIIDIALQSFTDKSTGIKYANANCTSSDTFTDSSRLNTAPPEFYCAESSSVNPQCLNLVGISTSVCVTSAASRPKCNLSMAVDILACDVEDHSMDGYVDIDSNFSDLPSSESADLYDLIPEGFAIGSHDTSVSKAPQDGQSHPKEPNDGKETGNQGGSSSGTGSGADGKSGNSTNGSQRDAFFRSGSSGASGAGGGSNGGDGNDPWERRIKRSHEQDLKSPSKKDKKSESTDDDSEEEDGYGTVIRADVVKGNGKRRSGAYSVEKVVQHISFKPIQVEDKRMEIKVSKAPEIVIPVMRMSTAQTKDSACTVKQSPVLEGDLTMRMMSEDSMTGMADLGNASAFQDMCQKMWKPSEEMMMPGTGKQETTVRKSMDYEFKSSDGTHVKEAWSTTEDGTKRPETMPGHTAIEPQKQTDRKQVEQSHQAAEGKPPIVQHQFKMPRKDGNEEDHVYATVRQTAHIPQYSPRSSVVERTSMSEEKSQQEIGHTWESQPRLPARQYRQDPDINPDGIIQTFRRRASKEDIRDSHDNVDVTTDGLGMHHCMVEVQAHEPIASQTVETSSDSRQQQISTAKISRQIRRGQSSAEHNVSSSTVEYSMRAASEDKDLYRPDMMSNVLRSNSSDAVISGRPPLPPLKRRGDESDLPDDDPMKLFPMLQYLSKKDADSFMKRLSNSQVKSSTTHEESSMYEAAYLAEQRRMQAQNAAMPANQMQGSGTSGPFDTLQACQPIPPIGEIAFCAQEGTEEAPLTNFGCIDIVASYDAEDENDSSWMSDTTGYSDDEYISKHSRSAGSMSDTRSETLSTTDDGTYKMYHDGKLVAKVQNQKAKKTMQQTADVSSKGPVTSQENWLYRFPSNASEGIQWHQDGSLASIQKGQLQNIPHLEKYSPIVKQESSKAYIEDSIPGQYAEERYDTKLIHQDLGKLGSLTGMHASTFTHTKTGTWEENQNQGGLPVRIQRVQQEKSREENYTSRQCQSDSLQDRYETVVDNLKRRILGFGSQQNPMLLSQEPYVEYPASTMDTSTHGSRDFSSGSSVTGRSSVSSMSTTSSDKKRNASPQMQFPGGVRGEDGVLRVFYDEEIISDIKNTLHASIGTRMIDDGKVLRVYQDGNMVAEINRRPGVTMSDSQPMERVRDISLPPGGHTLSTQEIPELMMAKLAEQHEVQVSLNRPNGAPVTYSTEKIYENEDKGSVTDSVSIRSDTEDEYFFEEYTIEHKVPLYEDLQAAAAVKPEDKVTGVFSYYKKKDRDGDVKANEHDSYLERMQIMQREKEAKAAEVKERMMKIHLVQPESQTATIKQDTFVKKSPVTVSQPVTVQAPMHRPKSKPKPPQRYRQQTVDVRSQYLKNRPLPEIPKDDDEMSVCSTSSWMTEDTESTITGNAINQESAEQYKVMYQQYKEYQNQCRKEEERRRLMSPTKVPPVPPPRKHKKIPPMEEYIQRKENTPISGAEAMMKDALRKIDDMYASLTRKKIVPKYARKKQVPQPQKQMDLRRVELIEEVKKHLYELRSQYGGPMTPEYKAELAREIKKRIYESRLSEIRPQTESSAQRWVLQTKKARDFDEVSEADSTSSWCTVASGSTVASQRAPFGEVTVIVEPNSNTDPRKSVRRFAETSYKLHQTSDEDHADSQYMRRTVPRQQHMQVRQYSLPPVEEYQDPRILQEIQRKQQLLDAYRQQQQYRQNTMRQGYHTMNQTTQYQQRYGHNARHDVPQIEERSPSPDPIYIEHVELQEIARHEIGQQQQELSIEPEPEPVYIEHEQVELQEIKRHTLNNRVNIANNARDNRISWAGEPSVKMLESSGKRGSMPLLDDDLYDNMLKMMSGVSKPETEEQTYDNLPGEEKDTASPLSMSPTNEPEDVTRQKTEQYLQSAYKFINEGNYDYLDNPDVTPKVKYRTQSYDALDTMADVHPDTLKREVQQRRRAVSQSDVIEQESMPIRGNAFQRQVNRQHDQQVRDGSTRHGVQYAREETAIPAPQNIAQYNRDMSSTHGSYSNSMNVRNNEQFQSSHQGRAMSQDRLLQDPQLAAMQQRHPDFNARSSSLPPGINSAQMKAEGHSQVRQQSYQTANRSTTLPPQVLPKPKVSSQVQQGSSMTGHTYASSSKVPSSGGMSHVQHFPAQTVSQTLPYVSSSKVRTSASVSQMSQGQGQAAGQTSTLPSQVLPSSDVIIEHDATQNRQSRLPPTQKSVQQQQISSHERQEQVSSYRQQQMSSRELQQQQQQISSQQQRSHGQSEQTSSLKLTGASAARSPTRPAVPPKPKLDTIKQNLPFQTRGQGQVSGSSTSRNSQQIQSNRSVSSQQEHLAGQQFQSVRAVAGQQRQEQQEVKSARSVSTQQGWQDTQQVPTSRVIAAGAQNTARTQAHEYGRENFQRQGSAPPADRQHFYTQEQPVASAQVRSSSAEGHRQRQISTGSSGAEQVRTQVGVHRPQYVMQSHHGTQSHQGAQRISHQQQAPMRSTSQSSTVSASHSLPSSSRRAGADR